MNSDIPATPDEIDPWWLSRVLGAPIESVEWSPVGDVQGFVGVVVRLRLGHDGRFPDSLIAKLAATNDQSLQYVRNYGLYRSEYHFYTECAARTPINVPRCHYAAVSDDGMSVVLLLDDIGKYRLGDQLAGAAASDAERVVRTSARLHAAWWARPELDAMEWLPAIDADLNKARAGHAAHAWDLFLERHGDCVSSAVRAVAEQIPTVLPALMDAWRHRGPITYVHFDTRLDNIFFDDNTGGPDGVHLIDWQMSVRGPGALDLAWFLAWSLVPDVRRQNWDRLLDAYLDELMLGGVGDYGRAALDRDVRQALVMVLAMAILGGATAPTPDERSASVIRALVERVCSCVDDLDVLAHV